MKHSKFSSLDVALAHMSYMAGHLLVKHQLGQPTTYSLPTYWIDQIQNYARLPKHHPLRKQYPQAQVERTLYTLGINPILAKQ